MKYSLINITSDCKYYRQYFNNVNQFGLHYMDYCLAICGIFLYTGVQAQTFIIQALEQTKQQMYQTASRADIVTVDYAKLITKDEYYHCHFEDNCTK